MLPPLSAKQGVVLGRVHIGVQLLPAIEFQLIQPGLVCPRRAVKTLHHATDAHKRPVLNDDGNPTRILRDLPQGLRRVVNAILVMPGQHDCRLSAVPACGQNIALRLIQCFRIIDVHSRQSRADRQVVLRRADVYPGMACFVAGGAGRFQGAAGFGDHLRHDLKRGVIGPRSSVNHDTPMQRHRCPGGFNTLRRWKHPHGFGGQLWRRGIRVLVRDEAPQDQDGNEQGRHQRRAVPGYTPLQRLPP